MNRQYIIRRILIAIPSLLGISVILFGVLAMAPGDPFEELATNPAIPPEIRQALRAKFGLDDPVWQRYLHWLSAMVQGDWGFSFQSRMDVDKLILQRLPVTLIVIGASQLLAISVAIPVGVLAAIKPYSIFDQVASTFAMIGFSLPTFFTGLVLILVFSIQLDWLPFVYRADINATGWAFYWEHIKQSIMPVVVLGLAQAGTLVRFMRSSVLDVIRLDYVTTARSKGIGERKVIIKHVVRNAMIPVVTLIALAAAGRVRRRHRHRADFPRTRHRLAADRGDPCQRHSCRDGRHLRDRLPRRPLQPYRRHPLWLARPPHLFPLKRPSGRPRPQPSRARRARSRRRSKPGGASAAMCWL